MRSVGRPPTAAVIVAVIGLGAFVVLPLAGVAQRVAWSSLVHDVTSPAALTAARLSLFVSLAATAIAAVIGIPLAWLLARVDFTGKRIVRALAVLPIVLPPVVGGVALLAAFGRRGIAGQALDAVGVHLPFTTTGAVLAATFVAMPFFVLVVEGALRSLDVGYEEAAATLGAGPWRTGVLAMRQIAPALASGAVLVWARALGEFGATITFAGNVAGRTQTMPLAVYLALESDPEAALALSLVLVAVAVAVLAVTGRRALGARP